MSMVRKPIVGSALLILFLLLTVAVVTHMTASFDQAVDMFLYIHRTVSGVSLFGLITLLGNVFVVLGIAGLIAILLLFMRQRLLLIGFIITLGGAALSDYLLKLLIARPRPLPPLPVSLETSFSYPSGHATASMALYGYLLFLAWILLPYRWEKIVASVLLSCIILVVGVSRLYLGAHFPTDILGGYLLSGMWLLIGIQYIKIKTRSIKNRV